MRATRKIKELARAAKIASTKRKGNMDEYRVKNASTLTVRNDKILAQRLAFALNHPVSDHQVLLDIDACATLLARVAPPQVEEVEDDD